MAPDAVKNLSTALNEIIRTLPVRSGTNPTETDSPQPAVIADPVTPLLGRSPAGQEQSQSSEESPKTSDPDDPGTDGTTLAAIAGSDSIARSRSLHDRPGPEDRAARTSAPTEPLLLDPAGESAGQPRPDHTNSLIGGRALAIPGSEEGSVSTAETASIAVVGRPAIGGPAATSGQRSVDRSDLIHADLSVGSAFAGVQTVGTPSRGDENSPRTEPAPQSLASIGSIGRSEEPYDLAAGPSSPASWGETSGADLTSRRDAAPGVPQAGQSSNDTARTNTLLEQILDELRRAQQSTYTASARSVYPER
jgi:hypothetical protein